MGARQVEWTVDSTTSSGESTTFFGRSAYRDDFMTGVSGPVADKASIHAIMDELGF
jgi:hypothetical protein